MLATQLGHLLCTSAYLTKTALQLRWQIWHIRMCYENGTEDIRSSRISSQITASFRRGQSSPDRTNGKSQKRHWQHLARYNNSDDKVITLAEIVITSVFRRTFSRSRCSKKFKANVSGNPMNREPNNYALALTISSQLVVKRSGPKRQAPQPEPDTNIFTSHIK